MKPIKRPAELTGDQADEFFEIASMLQDRIKGFRESDAPGLARLIQLRGVWQKLLCDIATNGETFTGSNGVERIRPQSRILVQLAGEIAKLERQYGLTPETRSRERTAVDDIFEGGR